MKRINIYLLSALVALASCAKESEVEDIQRQVDNLKSTEIATLTRQVENISASLRSLEAADAEIRAYITVLQEQARDLAEADRTQTARINEVKSGLSASITSEKQALLDALNAYKTELEGRISAIDASIASLESQDADLQDRITWLRAYIDGDLKAFIDKGDADARTWVSATFMTLEQYQGIVSDIAGIRADITSLNAALDDLEGRMNGKIAADIAAAASGVEDDIAQKVTEITAAYTSAISSAKTEMTAAYTEALAAAIASSETSMQAWVNERLTGYYTIAAMDARLAALERALEGGDSANAEEIGRLRTELATARTELTTAYEQAIAAAITQYNGQIREHIASEIDAANARLTTLEDRVTALEAAVLGLQQLIDDLKSNEIASINDQIAGITSSIGSLQATDTELQGYITALQEQATALAAADEALSQRITALAEELGADLDAAKQALLSALDAFKAETDGRIAAVNASISALQAKDEALQGQIDGLEEYIESTLKPSIGQGDTDARAWVSATFMTLEKYQEISGSIAGIGADIALINTTMTDFESRLERKIETDIAAAVSGIEADLAQRVTEITSAYTGAISTAKDEITAAYTTAISEAIAASEASIQAWVNERLSGYYTLAAMEAALEAVGRLISEGDAANSAEITRLGTDIATARSELTAAYEQAIAAAITQYDGQIREHIASQIASANSGLEPLEGRVTALETAVTGLRSEVDALLGMIQSVVVIPDYSDGSVKCTPGEREYRFMVSPASAVEELAAVGPSVFRMKAMQTLTKAAPEFIDMPVSSVDYASGGVLIVRASGAGLPEELFTGDISATACLTITSGVSSYQTAWFPLSGVSELQDMIEAIPVTMTTTNFLGFSRDHWDFGLPSIHIITESMLEDLVTMGDNTGYNRYYQWKANRYQGADSDYCNYIWTAYYTYIKGANDIIGTIDPSSASDAVLSFLGQAYTWRASYYLDLARMYDPIDNGYTDISSVRGLTVPIVTESTVAGSDNPRASRSEILEFILSDLDKAKTYINPSLKDFTQPTLAAVYALYAKTYLTKGVWEGDVSCFNYAAEYAGMAIGQSGAIPLTQDEWENPSSGFNSGASVSSWIWGLRPSADNLDSIITFTSMMSNEATWGYAPYVRVGCSKRFFDSISDSDFRKHSWIDPSLTYNYRFSGSSSARDAFAAKISPYLSIKFRPAGGATDSQAVGNAADHPILRVEELWFIKMEALARGGDLPAAKALLNEFMAMRCTDGSYDCSSIDDQSSFLEEMLLQKRIEFWGEGVLYFDYKRFEHNITRGYEGTNEAGVFRLNTVGPSPQWNFVIPSSEIESNGGIPSSANNPDPSGLLNPWES